MEDNKIDEEKTKNTSHPRENASILSVIFFCWAIPTFMKGYKKEFDEGDLFGPLKDHDSSILGDRFEKAWIKEQRLHSKPSLWKTLLRVCYVELIIQGIVAVFMEFVLKLSQPLCLGKLISYYTPYQTTITKNEAYMYASFIITASFLNVLMGHNYMFSLQHLGMKMRVGCCSLIYRKALRLSKTALAKTTIGQMVNLLSNDVNRFDYAMIHFHSLWVAPLETIVILYLLYTQVGITGIAGAGFLVLMIPLQMYLGKKSSEYRLKTAFKTDERVRLMNEIISGIQVIKMYTWEIPFAKLVAQARKMEIKQIRAASYIRAAMLSFTIFTTRFAIFITIVTYVLVGNNPKAKYVFVVTAFYNMLRQAMTIFFPQGISQLAETSVSINRIRTFLLYDEIHVDTDYKRIAFKKESKNKNTENGSAFSMMSENGGTSFGITQHKFGINLKNATTKWINTSPENTLSNINLIIEEKQLMAIVGPVGCGKTSLLHVILKELPLISGSVNVNGRISYASQEPWLFSGSIKQNILFGQSMNVKRYQEVIRVCALERDFALFPFGDRTVVGDRGVTLSGGQKARINLARAVYKEADIYLLDDPLSAVDAHVGKQLFDECISGFLDDKCTILVTHQLQYLRNVSKIVLLENGIVSAIGTYKELQESGKDFTEMLAIQPDEEKIGDGPKKEQKEFKELDEKNDLPVESKESRSFGRISGKVYKSYLKAGGKYYCSILILLTFFMTQLSASSADYFITFWVNLEQQKEENITHTYNNFFTRDNCIYIYTAIISVVIFITLTRSMSFFKFCMRASTNLHNNMFNKIVSGKMRFFNKNASGRILNRFSKDMGSIDEILPSVIIDTMQIGLNVLGISIVIAVVNYWVLIPTLLILTMFYFMRVFYLATSRNIKRLEGTTRSPVFTHLNASLQGLTTIRAFGAQAVLEKEFDNHQDLHSSAFYLFLGCTRTFGFWLDIICSIYIGLVTMSFLFIGQENYGGNVGLAITQAIGLTGMFQWGMRQWSELENQMTAVERVVEYTEVEHEVEKNNRKPPSFWPEEGNIFFNGVSLRYSLDEPYVLKKLTFNIAPNDKIGIVGRTGAGKSSLIAALFLLTDIEGDIIIDGINIKDISLNSLRSKISIIPQEPVLFSGTLRKNLDPFDEYEDHALWNALEEVELKSVVSDLPSGIDSKMSEGGSNFSVGQRQLLCLARAIVRNNKILVLDEATANVDPKTDSLIQTTIRNKFADCTVLTIAHRLHTIIDSDKVLVMDAGRVMEYEHPFLLLRNKEGVFYKLVQQTGKSMTDSLMKIAETSHKSLQKLL